MQVYHAMNPILIQGFLHALKMACDTDRIQDAPARWFSNFMRAQRRSTGNTLMGRK